MQILNIMQCTNLGGMEQSALRQMQGLRARGHTFRVVSVNPLGELRQRLDAAGISAVGIPFEGRLGWRSHLRLRNAIRTAMPSDAVMMTGPSLSGILALGRSGMERRVLTVHYHHTGVKPRWTWKALYGLVERRFHAVTFPSDYIRREAEAIYPPLARLSHTVHYPLPLAELPSAEQKRAARATFNLSLDAPVVGNAGWLTVRKRFDIFLRVAQKVKQKVTAAQFLIAGDGEERERLQTLARELGIADSVRWLGWQVDMIPFYHAVSVLLFNSDWDAMGLTPLEALTHGVPAVASVAHGGLGEVLTPDRYPLLMDGHDVIRLTDAVVDLIETPTWAAEVASRGRERIAELSDPGMIAETYERLLGGGL
jgi:glycosyltransferase involved in cell wall biosynthesis